MRFFSSYLTEKIQQFTFIFGAAFGMMSAAQAADIVPNIVTSSTKVTTQQNVTAQAKPLWATLSPQQRLALAPLAPVWDSMDEIRKRKWLEIANKYAAMKPDEQARVQERMQTWMKLTPEQRMQARENFARTTQIKPERKSAQWQEYQQLSDDQKKHLASEASKKKSVTNLPPESQRNVKPLAPIKIGPKPAPATPAPHVVMPVSPPSGQADATINAPASQATVTTVK